jgi:hypothetical protein
MFSVSKMEKQIGSSGRMEQENSPIKCNSVALMKITRIFATSEI